MIETGAATRIVERLDVLAADWAAGDGTATGQWAVDEGQWVNENMASLIDQEYMIEYITNVLGLLQQVGDGADQTDAVATLVAMRNDIAASAGLTASAATPKPTPDPTAKPTPKPTPIAYKKLSDRAWKLIVKSPDKYTGRAYQLWACIFQFDAATGDDSFLANASNKKQEYWNLYGENTSFTGDASRLAPFVQGDIVFMKVISTGSYSYDTQAGGNTTVPSFQVKSISRKGSCN